MTKRKRTAQQEGFKNKILEGLEASAAVPADPGTGIESGHKKKMGDPKTKRLAKTRKNLTGTAITDKRNP